MTEQTNRMDQKNKSHVRPSEDPLTDADDPGGAHGKGYCGEVDEGADVPAEGPVPLVSDDEVRGHAEKPDQSQAVKPAAPREYTPNDRLTGADR